MLESFGARLRQRREEQSIALGAIAERTKIKLSLLESLERDDVSHWPSGIYRRAYIRSYAQAIGLDPDVVVREFLEVHPEPDEVLAAEAIAAAAENLRTNGGPPTRLRYIMGSAIGSLARLRRSPGSEEPGLAPGPPVHAPVPSMPDYRIAPYPSAQPLRGEAVDPVEATDPPDDEPVECLPVSLPASPGPRLAAFDDRCPEPGPGPGVDRADPDLMAVAHLCTELGRVDDTTEVQPLLEEAAGILGAAGLIVWIWNGSVDGLQAAFAHGYSDQVLAQLPIVRPDDDNATAAAFRSARTCALHGSDHASGALVAPLLTSEGCAGVLAIELQHGREPTTSLRAVATILAALLAQLAGTTRSYESGPQAELTRAADGELDHAGYSYRSAACSEETPQPAPARDRSVLGGF